MSSHQPPTADDARLDLHNSEVNDLAAELHRCGMTHLASGQVCTLPERHSGGCDFGQPPRP